MNSKLKRFLQPVVLTNRISVALLILRLVVGAAFLYHGWGKIQSPMNWMPPQAPVPGFFQLLAAISEFGGGLALVLGLLLPIAMLGLAFTMLVATFFVASQGAPFVSPTGGMSYELSTVFFAIAILYMLMGAGKFSLDYKLFGPRNS